MRSVQVHSKGAFGGARADPYIYTYICICTYIRFIYMGLQRSYISGAAIKDSDKDG